MDEKPRLLDQVRIKIRTKHYSIRTEHSYVDWIKRFILFYNKRHPKDLGAHEIEQFLSHLAVQRNVAPSTQNQALSAILFLYREVLDLELDWIQNVIRAKKPERLPVVLTRTEVQAVLPRLGGQNKLMANLLYGAGLRLMECMRLRVKDVDFDYRQIVIRDGKGHKDRVTMLPERLIAPLRDQLERARHYHQTDLSQGFGEIYLPYALERKYPTANREWGWQYIFFAKQRSTDPRAGKIRRHHIDPKVLQRAVKQAVRDAGIAKPASCHTMRHAFATHLLENGYDIRTVQELMGHKDVRTTMIYTHVLKSGGRGVRSPLD